MDSSNFWKLDKIDKIGIALIFIIFAIYSTFSCFASEEEVLIPSIIDNASISTNGRINSVEGFSVCYYEILPGYTYILRNNSTGNKSFGFSNDILSVNDYVSEVSSLARDSEFTFTYSDIDYVYINYTNNSTNQVSLSRVALEGMDGSVDLLTGYVGFNVWESFSNTIVYALPITITCFGIYIICGFIKRFSKGV